MLSLLTFFAVSNPPPIFSWPPRYTIRGTWNVPYTNLSNPITIVHEPNRQYTDKLNGLERIWTTTAEEHTHRKIVGAGDKFICYGYNKPSTEWDLELTQFLPDPDGFVAQEGLYSYMGHSCNLYIRTEETAKPQTWKIYTDNVTGYPVGYVMQAISIYNSHYDVYVLNIDEFIPDALPGVWAFPIMCQNAASLPDDPYPYSQLNLFFPGKGSVENMKAVKSKKIQHVPHFAHMKPKSWLKTISGGKLRRNLRGSDFDICKTADETAKLLDDSIDINFTEFSWRDNKEFKVVGPPRDQVACGSCWAFGTAEVLESAFALKMKKDTSVISVNQVMDCTWEGNNFGCQGGEVNRALSIFKNDTIHIALESDYPYLGASGICENNYKNPQEHNLKTLGRVENCYHIPRTREMVKRALMKFGPLSIGINVVESMSLYTSGAFNDTTCTGTANDLVHAVLLTGWRVIDGIEVWEVKNSWSTYWGDEGYVYIQSEFPEWNCGVTTDAVAVTVTLDEN